MLKTVHNTTYDDGHEIEVELGRVVAHVAGDTAGRNVFIQITAEEEKGEEHCKQTKHILKYNKKHY